MTWSVPLIVVVVLGVSGAIVAVRWFQRRRTLRTRMAQSIEFDAESKAIIERACEVAQRYGQPYIAPEHLLLALIEAPESKGLLQQIHDNPEVTALQSQLLVALPPASSAPTNTVPLSLLPTYTSRAARVLRLAVDSAVAEYPRDATPRDLLRGLLREGRSRAALILRANGITEDAVNR